MDEFAMKVWFMLAAVACFLLAGGQLHKAMLVPYDKSVDPSTAIAATLALLFGGFLMVVAYVG